MTGSWFSIDVRGSITPESADAQQELSRRAGRFALAPTGHDLLCLLRVPPTGTGAPAPRAVLVGDAAAFPISDLIAFLSQARWSGALKVQASNGERSLLLKDGEVRGATSDDPADRLGEVIVRLGFLGRRQLEEALEETQSAKIGRALVEKGVLQPHDLWRCITQQLSDIFHAIVLCREGAFTLLQQELDEKAASLVQLSTQSLLMDSIRKIDEMAHFRKRIPHGRIYVSKKRASDGKLEEDEDRVLGLVNGERTVVELGKAAKLSEFDVTKVVFRLLEGGYAIVSECSIAAVAQHTPEASSHPRPLEPRRPADASPASAKEPLAVVRVFNFIFREIRDEVAKQGRDRQFIAAANAALAGQALSASPVLTGVFFDAEGNLDEGKLMRRFEFSRDQLGSEPIASLKQALSDVMFFLLFQAGELLESRADEDLARRVKELLATLEGELP
jgi:hypothetical protein